MVFNQERAMFTIDSNIVGELSPLSILSNFVLDDRNPIEINVK